MWNVEGVKLKTVSIRHLAELKEDVEKLQRQGLLDKHLAEVYLQFNYDMSAALPGARCFTYCCYASTVDQCCFQLEGQMYHCDILLPISGKPMTPGSKMP